MGMDPKARVFYGARIDTGKLPEAVEELYEEIGSFEEVLSFYLLKEAGYTPAEYGNEDELIKRTGLRVLALDSDGVYLAIDDTYHYRSGHGVDRFEMNSVQLEEILTLEVYAARLGSPVQIGSWFLAADFS